LATSDDKFWQQTKTIIKSKLVKTFTQEISFKEDMQSNLNEKTIELFLNRCQFF
jgi:hypothetical protein